MPKRLRKSESFVVDNNKTLPCFLLLKKQVHFSELTQFCVCDILLLSTG